MTKDALKMFRFVRVALMASVGFPFIIASNAFAQLPAPAVPAAPGAPAPTAEVERVVVTGSNIPTAEETGPNPVDTYRPADLEKLGIRNAQDLETFLPQEAGGTVNLNIGKRVRCHGIELILVCSTTAQMTRGCRVLILARWSTGLANTMTTMSV